MSYTITKKCYIIHMFSAVNFYFFSQSIQRINYTKNGVNYTSVENNKPELRLTRKSNPAR